MKKNYNAPTEEQLKTIQTINDWVGCEPFKGKTKNAAMDYITKYYGKMLQAQQEEEELKKLWRMDK